VTQLDSGRLSTVRSVAQVISTAAIVLLLSVVAGTMPAQAYSSPSIWVGSPVKGTWGAEGDSSTTPNGDHHRLVKASPQNDWAVDLPSLAGTDVYLYVAPSDSRHKAISTRVSQIIDDSACRLGGGGDLVTVSVYFNEMLYGQVTYAHLDRDGSLYVGKQIPRWGTHLGKVANLPPGATGGSNCWTGPHVHFEMRAETQKACWNKGYSYSGYPVSRTNFLGFVSGPLSGTATRCP
jgi:hypothetical protein